eukprot:scaffold30879_cov32-Tisochrysis_lutea.AAC.5
MTPSCAPERTRGSNGMMARDEISDVPWASRMRALSSPVATLHTLKRDPWCADTATSKSGE